VATQYYKDLFKSESKPGIDISRDFFSEGEKVTLEENSSLQEMFSEEEIKRVVFE
jgi:hypothetical protein